MFEVECLKGLVEVICSAVATVAPYGGPNMTIAQKSAKRLARAEPRTSCPQERIYSIFPIPVASKAASASNYGMIIR